MILIKSGSEATLVLAAKRKSEKKHQKNGKTEKNREKLGRQKRKFLYTVEK